MQYNSVVFLSNLKAERARKGWRQADLAKESGMCEASIAKYESGSVTPSLEAAFKMANALNCGIDELVGLPEPYRREVV